MPSKRRRSVTNVTGAEASGDEAARPAPTSVPQPTTPAIVVPPSEALQSRLGSVCQVVVTACEYNAELPFLDPTVSGHTGSGFVYDMPTIKDEYTYILTNAHVANASRLLQVKFNVFKQELFTAELVWCAPCRDLALIRAKLPQRLPPLELAPDSLAVKQSDPVYVVGHPLGERRAQITHGHISGFSLGGPGGDEHTSPYQDVDVEVTSYLQTTAAVNPGNSGGPLLNAQHQVIGVCSAGIMFASNVAYAIPSNTIRAAVPRGVTVEEGAIEGILLYPPMLGFATNRLVTGDGLYIYDVFAASIFADPDYRADEDAELTKLAHRAGVDGAEAPAVGSSVKVGDILRAITIEAAGAERRALTFTFDAYGSGSLEGMGDRCFTLQDIEPMINVGSVVRVEVDRPLPGVKKGKNTGTVRKTFAAPYMALPAARAMVRRVFPSVPDDAHRWQWLVVGGMVMMENITRKIAFLSVANRCKRRVYVTNVLPGSRMQDKGVPVNTALRAINGERVYTLNDVRRALARASPAHVSFHDKRSYYLDWKACEEEDKRIVASYKIS